MRGNDVCGRGVLFRVPHPVCGGSALGLRRHDSGIEPRVLQLPQEAPLPCKHLATEIVPRHSGEGRGSSCEGSWQEDYHHRRIQRSQRPTCNEHDCRESRDRRLQAHCLVRERETFRSCLWQGSRGHHGRRRRGHGARGMRRQHIVKHGHAHGPFRLSFKAAKYTVFAWLLCALHGSTL